MPTESTKSSLSEDTDKLRAASTFDQHVIDSDIGQGEAWSVNLKMLVEDAMENIRRNRLHFDKMITAAQSHDDDVRLLSLTALKNAVTDSESIRARSMDHWGTMFDKQVNINETDALAVGMVQSLSKNPVQLDALAGLIIQSMAKAKDAE